MQVQIAMGANPLTGLPGNVAIEQEVNRRAGGGIPSSLIYVDLDNFKVFNGADRFKRRRALIGAAYPSRCRRTRFLPSCLA